MAFCNSVALVVSAQAISPENKTKHTIRCMRFEYRVRRGYPEVMPVFHDPNTAVLALVIGLLGILFEFHAPGTIFPGVIGSALVLLAASALSRYPLSPGAVALIAIATLLLVLELKITSHGAIAATGAVLLACGIYLLVDSPDPAEHIHLTTVLGIVLPFGLLTAFLITIAARASANKAVTGTNRLVGQTGKVVAAPNLRILVGGEYWNAAAQEKLEPGTAVRIDSVSGLELRVSPLHDRIVTT